MDTPLTPPTVRRWPALMQLALDAITTGDEIRATLALLLAGPATADAPPLDTEDDHGS